MNYIPFKRWALLVTVLRDQLHHEIAMSRHTHAAARHGLEAGLRALLIVLRSLRLGSQFATKVRLPHSLVTGLLYSQDALKQPSKIVQKALETSFEHARNLALFAATYKLCLLALRIATAAVAAPHAATSASPSASPVPSPTAMFSLDISSLGRPARHWHAAVAGGIGAALIWRRHSSVNLQILLYLLPRVAMGLCRLAADRGWPPFSWTALRYENSYQLMQILTWSVVMAMWEGQGTRGSLQPSLVGSMDAIYRAADGEQPPRHRASPTHSPMASSAAAVLPAVSAPGGWRSYLPNPATTAVVAYGIAAGLPLWPGVAR